MGRDGMGAEVQRTYSVNNVSDLDALERGKSGADVAHEPASARLVSSGVTPSGNCSMFTRKGRRAGHQDAAIVWEAFGDDPEAVLVGVVDSQGTDAWRLSAKIRDSLSALLLDEHRAASDPISCIQSGRPLRASARSLRRSPRQGSSLNPQVLSSLSMEESMGGSLRNPRKSLGGAPTGPPARIYRSTTFGADLDQAARGSQRVGSFPDLPSLARELYTPIADQENAPTPTGFLSHLSPSKSLPVLSDCEWESAFERMNRALHRQSSRWSSGADQLNAATTAVALLQGRKLTVAYLGTCRAVLGLRGLDGVLRPQQLTRDHRPGLTEERERVEAAGAAVIAADPGKANHGLGAEWNRGSLRVAVPGVGGPCLAATRAFGDEVLQDHGVIAVPGIVQMDLDESAEFLVLASEGVWDVVTPDEALHAVEHHSESSLKRAASALSLPWLQHSQSFHDLYGLAHVHGNAAKRVVDLATRRWGLRGRGGISAVVLHLTKTPSSGSSEGVPERSLSVSSTPSTFFHGA